MATKKAYLADFGISKFVVACTGTNNTQPLQIRGGGTAAFLPPEQLSAKYDGTGCDVYACGGVLYELFSEKQMWPGLLPYQIIAKVVTLGETPDVSLIPCTEVQQICTSCFRPLQDRPLIINILKKLIDIWQ